jgi:hypothetical protein
MSGQYQLFAQDCCMEPVPSDGLNRDYTIRVAMGVAGDGGTPLFACPPVGPMGNMDASSGDAIDDSSMDGMMGPDM